MLPGKSIIPWADRVLLGLPRERLRSSPKCYCVLGKGIQDENITVGGEICSRMERCKNQSGSTGFPWGYCRWPGLGAGGELLVVKQQPTNARPSIFGMHRQGPEVQDRPGKQQERVPDPPVPPERNALRALPAALQVPAEQQAAVPGLPLLHLQELQPLQQEGAGLGL